MTAGVSHFEKIKGCILVWLQPLLLRSKGIQGCACVTRDLPVKVADPLQDSMAAAMIEDPGQGFLPLKLP